jgi:hypothetical protein
MMRQASMLRLTIPHLAGTSKMSKITTEEGTEIVIVCPNMLFPAEVAADLQLGMVLYITARVRYVKYVITAPKYFTHYVTVM